MVDHYSKWMEAYPLPNQEAVTIGTALLEDWISILGVPLELHSNHGRNFESNVFGEVAQLLGLRKTRTLPRNLQSEGIVGRFNHFIQSY